MSSTQTATGTGTQVSSTKTTAVPTSTAPSVKQNVGNWGFQGCYTETTNGRALSGKTLAEDQMTLEMCADFCGDFSFFGVEYGRECYCGNTLREGSVPAQNQKDCSFLCPGDKTTYCGAGNRLQLYKKGGSATSSSVEEERIITTTAVRTSSTSSVSTTSTTSVSTTLSTATLSTTTTKVSTTSTSARPTSTGPVVFEGNTNFTSYSCVREPSAGRLLPRQIFNDGANMTINACLERCWNFNYAGVEYGRECWCGDKLNLAGNTGATPGRNVTSSECSFLCPGDKNVYCGAGSRMSLYVRKDYDE